VNAALWTWAARAGLHRARRASKSYKLALHREIGKQLHVMYDPVAKDELPTQLQDLMHRLNKQSH
jgi:hypothetical protein